VTTAQALADFRAGLVAGRSAFGTFATLGAPAAVEFAAADGFDFVVVDCQHGLAGPADMVSSLRAMAAYPTIPLVRVPAGDDAAIERTLDCGATGVIVPAVESGARAREVASRCRYPKEGTRSFGPIRSELLLGLDPAAANRLVLCLAMIETREGLHASEEICATPGIDGIFVGPADLAVSLGLAPTTEPLPGEHAEAIRHIRECAVRNGLFAGIHAGTGAQAAARAAEGFSLVTVSGDAALLRWAMRKSLRDARQQDTAATAAKR
jgi:4-hydroxy-2-oxoheptanedioate aldolase